MTKRRPQSQMTPTSRRRRQISFALSAHAVFAFSLLLLSCTTGPSDGGSAKPVSQIKDDLSLVVSAGYTKICLFHMKAIRDMDDGELYSFLKSYAARGVEISVFVKDMSASEAIDTARRIGATTLITWNRSDADTFSMQGFKTAWWSLVAYPERNQSMPTYMGWPDLRQEQVRRDIAGRVLSEPALASSGLNLDYIRWNAIGDGRTADQVTDLLRKIRAGWSRARGALSVDVYPYLGTGEGDGGAGDVGQPWGRWLSEGLVDKVYPMAYISEDLPWMVPQWAPYGTGRVVPVLSVVDTSLE